MIFIKKKLEPKIRIGAKRSAFLLSYLFLVLFSLHSFSQDSIPAAIDLTEEKELKFQQFFFKALSEKSIGNHQRAIENLESCNQIISNNISVFFEFSKNYLELNKTLLAKEYINRALRKETDNIWMLEHLVKVNVKDKNFKAAIQTQKRVCVLNPKKRVYLARLYVYNKEYKKALSLLDELEKDNLLSGYLKRLKTNLEKQNKKKVVKEKPTDISSLINQFETDKSFKILEQILQKSLNNFEVILKHSEEGILLFPAQPYVYLMNGKALNYQKKYKKALVILENGIDFVIEDKMEANFYQEMARSFQGLGNKKEEKKYRQKANKLNN